MSGHGADISWDVLRRIVRDWAGSSADVRQIAQLEGGMINTTLALTLADGQKVVLKVTPHRVDRAHADEAAQLRLLREVGMPVPRVYADQVGTLDDPFSFILMEFVDGVDMAAAKASCSADEYEAIQRDLAEMLLRLHGNTDTHYHRVSSAAEPPKRFEAWPAFYREVFDAIWREVERSNVLPVKCRKTVGRVHDRLDRLLAHDDRPRLLHWDVWATNLLCKCGDGGRWGVCALLDPNCKYGHAEAEIAYMELFHTATRGFLDAYQHERRLPPDYQRIRKPIYQLYNLLNHVRLFGHEYLKPVMAQIEKVAPLV